MFYTLLSQIYFVLKGKGSTVTKANIHDCVDLEIRAIYGIEQGFYNPSLHKSMHWSNAAF